MQTYSDLFIDNGGETPIVQFLEPGTGNSPSSYFTDPARNFYWFLIDNQVANDGELTSMKFDGEYDVSDDGFFDGDLEVAMLNPTLGRRTFRRVDEMQLTDL